MCEGTEKEEALNYFGRKLKVLLEQKGFTATELAKLCGFSYKHLNNLFNGRKAPTAEVLKKIRDALNLTNIQVARLSLSHDTPELKGNGKLGITALVANRAGERTAGTLLFLDESILSEKFPEYHTDAFMEFTLKYITETYYDRKFEAIEMEEKEDKRISQTIGLNTDNLYLKEIVAMLLEMDPQTLIYVKENIEIYIRYHSNKSLN